MLSSGLVTDCPNTRWGFLDKEVVFSKGLFKYSLRLNTRARLVISTDVGD